MQLISIKKIKAEIRLLSGLHIGAGNDRIEIGGLDQPIMKNPLDGAPYIPGSSLKGKMRSLLETSVFMSKNDATRKAVSEGEPCGCGKASCLICKLFGPHKNANPDENLGQTRLLMRDAYLCQKDKELFQNGKLPMEIKYENIIHRVKGIADHPRPLERVPAGVCFDLNISLRIFEGDNEKELLKWIMTGLNLIELDALGGCSSRGCGQVKFENASIDGEKIDLSTFKNF